MKSKENTSIDFSKELEYAMKVTKDQPSPKMERIKPLIPSIIACLKETDASTEKWLFYKSKSSQKNQVAPKPFREFPLLLGICLIFKNFELELEIFHLGLGRISIRPYETHAVFQSKFF